ncbi:hypothetical protein EV426DRAFT_425172 [Tirmania nivea]|nr:hypothetical protein EV426DRAFT_425172 [Tirmania nivea]
MVGVVMGHTREIDAKGKAELEAAVGEVNKLLRESALTENRKAWTVTVKARSGEFKDESIWTVSGVAQDKEAVRVAGEVGRLLVTVFGRKGDILNVWAEEGKSVKMIASVTGRARGSDQGVRRRRRRLSRRGCHGGGCHGGAVTEEKTDCIGVT